MDGAGVALVGEVDAVAPTPFEQPLVEEVGVAEVTQALGGAHVQPDAEVGPGVRLGDEVEDAALVPPDGGAHDGDFAEDIGVLEAEVETDETAERGSSQAGLCGCRERPVGGVDEGFDLFDEDAAIGAALAAAELDVAGGGVFGHAAEAGIGDSDQDDGLGFASEGEPICGGVGLPGAGGDVGETWVEEVLAVVEIEDGEAAGGLGVVLRGQVDGDIALLGEGEELGMEVPGLESGFGLEAGIGGRLSCSERMKFGAKSGMWGEDSVPGQGMGEGVGRRSGFGWRSFSGGTPIS